MPFTLRQMLDHLVICQAVEGLKFYVALVCLARQVANVGGLLLGKPGLAHAGGGELQNRRRCNFAVGQHGCETPQNYGGYPSAELLVHNRSYERRKARLAMLNFVSPHAFDDGAEHGIGFLEVNNGLAHWNEN